MKVLYKSNLIWELIEVGKPGQWDGEIGLCGFPGTPLPRRSSCISRRFLWPVGPAFTLTSLPRLWRHIGQGLFYTTSGGLTHCTPVTPEFWPPWEALAWWPLSPKGTVGTGAMAVVLQPQPVRCRIFSPGTLESCATHGEKLEPTLRVTQAAVTHRLGVSGKQMFQWPAKDFQGGCFCCGNLQQKGWKLCQVSEQGLYPAVWWRLVPDFHLMLPPCCWVGFLARCTCSRLLTWEDQSMWQTGSCFAPGGWVSSVDSGMGPGTMLGSRAAPCLRLLQRAQALAGWDLESCSWEFCVLFQTINITQLCLCNAVLWDAAHGF